MSHRVKSPRSLLALAVLALTLATPARAALTVKSDDGWSATFSGFVNGFVVDSFGDKAPAGSADPYGRDTDQAVFRVRTGFLPACLGFDFAAPKWEGLQVKARVAFYPQINNGNTRLSLSPNIDTRELNFTVDGSFGQILLGRALNVYQQSNILSDMSLFGAGIPGGSNESGIPTLGHVGFGYIYPSFGAQLRYTTPEASGFKLMVAVADPSQVGSPPAVTAALTKAPSFEGELTWSMKSDGFTARAWVGGLYEQATFKDSAAAALRGKDVTASGFSAGLGLGAAGFDLLGSGYAGKGLGTFSMLDVDSLDGAGKERENMGYLVQLTYQAGKTKLGASYGTTTAKETDADAADRLAGTLHIDNRKAITGGVYHDLTPWMKLIAEYTNTKLTWFGGAKQNGNVISAGAFFFW